MSQGPSDPFQNNPYQNNPYANNPYQQQPATGPKAFMRQQFNQRQSGGGNHSPNLIAAGIALISVAAIDILFVLYGVLVNILQIVTGNRNEVDPARMQRLRQRGWNSDVDMMQSQGPYIGLVINLIWGALAAGVLIGGIAMVKRSGFNVALTGAIMAIIPCTGIMDCCLVEVGIGIWATVALCSGNSRIMFSHH